MRSYLVFCFLCLGFKSGIAGPCAKEDADAPRMLFVFGDSYADTGNAPPLSASWRSPYGMSWPRFPTGRFSDGLVKTDILAGEVLRIPSPVPYEQSPSVNTSIPGGVNFAVAGSGVTLAFGTPPLDEQVQWFSAYVQAAMVPPEDLRKAVAFVSVSGNDYAAYSTGTTREGYLSLVSQVVQLIGTNLKELYTLGLRNFMVSSLAPLSCLPARTYLTGYTNANCSGNGTVDQLVYRHNLLLESTISSLMTNLTGSNFIYLQQTKALSHILSNVSTFGLAEGLRPCCTGYCGEFGYSTCHDPGKHLFWDYFHPTEAGWKAVVQLYYSRPGYTVFSPSLKAWVLDLGCTNYTVDS